MRRPACCPTCKQPISSQWSGVRMPPLKADIASAIGKSGTVGITSQELWQQFLAQRGAAVSCVKSHINQINDLLVETDLEIIADGRGKNARWVVRSNAVKAA